MGRFLRVAADASFAGGLFFFVLALMPGLAKANGKKPSGDARADLCAAVVQSESQQKLPLRPDAVVTILRELYPDISLLKGSKEFDEAYANSIFAQATQDYLLMIDEKILYPFGRPETRELAGAFYRPTEYVEPDLRIELEKRKFRSPRTLATAEVWARFYGVRLLDDVSSLPSGERLEILQDVLSEMAKVPIEFVRVVEKAGKYIDVVLDNITSHPDLAILKGTTPAGWEGVGTWDIVPGAGSWSLKAPTVVAGNNLYRGHGSVSLVLHEYFHSVDSAFGELSGIGRFSEQPRFLLMHSLEEWSKYEQVENEAFAETMARYYHSDDSRAKLKEVNPEAYSYAKWLEAAVLQKKTY